MKRFFNETLIAVSIAAAFAVGTYNPLLGLSDATDEARLLLPARADRAALLEEADDARSPRWALASHESVRPR